MSSDTSFFKHFDHASRYSHFLFDTLDYYSHSVQIVLKRARFAVFGMGHRVANVSGDRKLKRKTFHRE